MAEHPDHLRDVACLRSCEDYDVHLCVSAPTLWSNYGLRLWSNKMNNKRRSDAAMSFLTVLVEKRLVTSHPMASDQMAPSRGDDVSRSSPR